MASEELCNAGCASVLGGESDFWVCVWVAEQLLELRIFVWCQVDEYRCGHVANILQRHLLARRWWALGLGQREDSLSRVKLVVEFTNKPIPLWVR